MLCFRETDNIVGPTALPGERFRVNDVARRLEPVREGVHRRGVVLSAYTGEDLDLSTPEGAYYGGMQTLHAKRETAVKRAAGNVRPLSGQLRRVHDQDVVPPKFAIQSRPS